jgi:hypothetical protein
MAEKYVRPSGSFDYMSGDGRSQLQASGDVTFGGGLGTLTPGISYSSNSQQVQQPDGVVVDESGRRIGISIGGELFLDDAGENSLRASIGREVASGDYEARLMQELLDSGAYEDAVNTFGLGADLGRFSADVTKRGDDISGRAQYRVGDNARFSVEGSNRGEPRFAFDFAKTFNQGGVVEADEDERDKMVRQMAAQMQALYEEDLAARGGAPRARTTPQKAGPLDLGVGLRERLAFLNQTLNPVESIGSAMGAGEQLLAGGIDPMDRVAALGDMLSGVAGVLPFGTLLRGGKAATSVADDVAREAAPQAVADEVVPQNDFYKILTGQIDAPSPSTLPPPPQAVSLSEQLFSRAPVPESSNPIGPRAGVGPARPSDPKAEALGFKDTVYHSTLSPEEFTQFDLSKQITGGSGRSFQDFLGVHVGTAKAASDRNIGASETAAGYSVLTPQGARVVDPQGYTMELRARTDNPLTKEKFAEMLGVPVEQFFKKADGPFQERDFELLQNEYANELLGTMPDLARRYDENTIPRPLVAAYLRKDLADRGFTHIPYVNAVEDRGSTSFIMLTDRDGRSPAVLRDVRAGFDPSKVNDPDLRFSDGGAVDPDDFYSLLNSVDVFALR